MLRRLRRSLGHGHRVMVTPLEAAYRLRLSACPQPPPVHPRCTGFPAASDERTSPQHARSPGWRASPSREPLAFPATDASESRPWNGSIRGSSRMPRLGRARRSCSPKPLGHPSGLWKAEPRLRVSRSRKKANAMPSARPWRWTRLSGLAAMLPGPRDAARFSMFSGRRDAMCENHMNDSRPTEGVRAARSAGRG